MEPQQHVRLAISMGDFNGIGPEIILKSLDYITGMGVTPVVIGQKSIFDYYANTLNLPLRKHTTISDQKDIEDGKINFLNLPDTDNGEPKPGSFSKLSGRQAMKAVDFGIRCCINGQANALVTAPISKEAINKAGYNYPGHTEFLAEKTDTQDYMMILAQDELRVGLVTIHIPIANVAGQITKERIGKNIRIMHQALQDDFNIATPRIAVLGLNPHAGDGGVIGQEEINIITPAIVDAESEDIKAKGPFPADGFFGNRRYKEFDGVLAMYHDQGLVPFKTLSFGGGVNVTAGLPIIRTSPDHGTAFDIAGKNVADPSSFQQAVKLAIKLSKNRQRHAEKA